MKNTYQFTFPFGRPVQSVLQTDRSPKKAFVLGVYASAVHAQWIGPDGKQKVSALAVASEPYIFWTGDNADQIISSIEIPNELGYLTLPRDQKLNGPSGRAIDSLFLDPLGLNRKNTWLCDLLPESRLNENQLKALKSNYTDFIIRKYHLPPANIPRFNPAELDSEIRRSEILLELEESKAKTLILLGDLPIYWFLRFFDKRFQKLSQFGNTSEKYGKSYLVIINGQEYSVIPLCHPRQASRLGKSNEKWSLLHEFWIKSTSQKLACKVL